MQFHLFILTSFISCGFSSVVNNHDNQFDQILFYPESIKQLDDIKITNQNSILINLVKSFKYLNSKIYNQMKSKIDENKLLNIPYFQNLLSSMNIPENISNKKLFVIDQIKMKILLERLKIYAWVEKFGFDNKLNYSFTSARSNLLKFCHPEDYDFGTLYKFNMEKKFKQKYGHNLSLIDVNEPLILNNTVSGVKKVKFENLKIKIISLLKSYIFDNQNSWNDELTNEIQLFCKNLFIDVNMIKNDESMEISFLNFKIIVNESTSTINQINCISNRFFINNDITNNYSENNNNIFQVQNNNNNNNVKKRTADIAGIVEEPNLSINDFYNIQDTQNIFKPKSAFKKIDKPFFPEELPIYYKDAFSPPISQDLILPTFKQFNNLKTNPFISSEERGKLLDQNFCFHFSEIKKLKYSLLSYENPFIKKICDVEEVYQKINYHHYKFFQLTNSLAKCVIED